MFQGKLKQIKAVLSGKHKYKFDKNSNQVDISPFYSKVYVKIKKGQKDNIVKIDKGNSASGNIKLAIYGSNNKINIVNPIGISDLSIDIGNPASPISNCEITIDEGVYIGGLKVCIEQVKSKLSIGKNTLISSNVFMRMGEVPHLIFDKTTAEYIDLPSNLSIGESVWIGEGATFMKSAKVSKGSIVGAKSVVTRKFLEENILIAGNPADIKKRNIVWVAGENAFSEDQKQYRESYLKFKKENY